MFIALERFPYDLEMKTREQNTKNKRTERERFGLSNAYKSTWLLVD